MLAIPGKAFCYRCFHNKHFYRSHISMRGRMIKKINNEDYVDSHQTKKMNAKVQKLSELRQAKINMMISLHKDKSQLGLYLLCYSSYWLRSSIFSLIAVAFYFSRSMHRVNLFSERWKGAELKVKKVLHCFTIWLPFLNSSNANSEMILTKFESFLKSCWDFEV